MIIAYGDLSARAVRSRLGLPHCCYMWIPVDQVICEFKLLIKMTENSRRGVLTSTLY